MTFKKMGIIQNESILNGPKRSLKPNLIHRLFENVAKGKYEDETAIIFEDDDKIKTHTYKALNKITNKLAKSIVASIKNSNASPNTDGDYIVAVCMLPTDKLVMTLLAIWKSGAAYLPIDASFPKDNVKHILNEAKPSLVIYEKDFEFHDQVLSKSVDDLLSNAETFPEETIKREECLKHKTDNIAIVLYTSGSTGIPKGVRLPHEVILNRLQWQFNTFPYSATETKCVFKTALTFGDSICEIWGPLLNGLSILVIPKKITQDPEKLIDLLEKYKIERLVLVPSLLRSLLLFLELQKNNNILRNLKTWVCSGEPLPVALAQEFFKYFPENEHILCNFYGSTEVMCDVAYHVISGLDQLKDQEKVPIGRPIDNTIIYLLDENLKPVDINSVGDLWVSGCNLAAGYVNGRDPGRFIPNPHKSMHLEFGKLYKTGDCARIEKETIIYEGRTDSQVKIRGHRVDLSEVERAVNSVENIEKGVVLCYHPGDIDQALLAFVTLKDGCLMSEMQIENILQKKLASYMLPQVVIMENIPLLVNGKIDRQTLLKSYENANNNDKTTIQREIDYTGVPDNQMRLAKILLETVAMVLNRSARGAIKIDANFYNIGGNSLNSILTITKLNEQGFYISIGDFIGAKDFKEVLSRMTPEKLNVLKKYSEIMKYTSEMLSLKHKDDVSKMITDSFYKKEGCKPWLNPHKMDNPKLLEKMWDEMIKKDLSFVVKTESGKTVGVTLNTDARDEPEVEIGSKFGIIDKFLAEIEAPVKESKLPPGKGTIFHSCMMATNSSLTTKENISVVQYMEEEVIRVARRKNFVGIFATNTSPLTQQLGTVYGYEVMADVQVNKYVAADGTKPFENDPDSKRAIVCWKLI